jgi:hypothetical protein
MTLSRFGHGIAGAAIVALVGLSALGSAHAQVGNSAPASEAPADAGATFLCQDGGKMVLSLQSIGAGVAAKVWLRGASYQLPLLPPITGLAQVSWSDGEHSLTWSPGVQLMWMSSDTHLMCGRGGHQH